MRLLTAHRILIGSFLVFCLFFATVQTRRWLVTRGGREAVSVVLSLGVAAASGFYLRSLRGKTL